MINVLCWIIGFLVGLVALLAYNLFWESREKKTLALILRQALEDLQRYAPDKVEFVKDKKDE